MNCKYCHKPAGFFSSQHKECRQKHLEAIELINMTINNCFIEASNDYDDISKELNKISTDGFINKVYLLHCYLKAYQSIFRIEQAIMNRL